jgi:hypothetical protein
VSNTAIRTFRFVTAALITVLPFAAHPASAARVNPEQLCYKALHFASAKYLDCQQRVLGKWFALGYLRRPVDEALSKCRVKYTETWPKLVSDFAYTTSSCAGLRFVDNGDGTVTDRLTTLQWEKKTDDDSIHDVDNTYPWSADPYHTAATGSAFSVFLRDLNDDACFAGQCDWRLPTVYELQTILSEPYGCPDSGYSACTDQTVFGPTAANVYWTATTLGPYTPQAWQVNFAGARLSNNEEWKSKDFAARVRAVRAGL